MADSLDNRRILTCGYGFWCTGRTCGIDLGIRRPVVLPSRWRYPPALEDVIEFLIAEKLAKPREGWRKVLDRGRDNFAGQCTASSAAQSRK
jgi:hypothetical protein